MCPNVILHQLNNAINCTNKLRANGVLKVIKSTCKTRVTQKDYQRQDVLETFCTCTFFKPCRNSCWLGELAWACEPVTQLEGLLSDLSHIPFGCLQTEFHSRTLDFSGQKLVVGIVNHTDHFIFKAAYK